MVCHKCGQNISDDSVICPFCAEQVAYKEQVAKIEAVKTNTKEIIFGAFKSKLFLACMIVLSVVCAGFLVPTFVGLANVKHLGSTISMLSAIVCIITPVISTVFGWLLFASKKKDPAKIAYLKAYPVFNKVMLIILLIVLALLFVCLTLAAVLLVVNVDGFSISDVLKEISATMPEMKGVADALSNMITNGAIVFLVAVLVAGTVSILLVGFYISSYGTMSKYFQRMRNAATTGAYNAEKGSGAIKLYIFGGIMVLLAVPSFLVKVETGIPVIASAAYMILFAVFFQNVHKAQQNNAEVLRAEVEHLNIIIEKTKYEISQRELEKRESRAQREREVREAQQQQQIMMQQMMQQMMMNMQGAVPAENPDDETTTS